jgi:hypothetical protein
VFNQSEDMAIWVGTFARLLLMMMGSLLGSPPPQHTNLVDRDATLAMLFR